MPKFGEGRRRQVINELETLANLPRGLVRGEVRGARTEAGAVRGGGGVTQAAREVARGVRAEAQETLADVRAGRRGAWQRARRLANVDLQNPEFQRRMRRRRGAARTNP